MKITKVYPINKSKSSSGNYSIMLDIVLPNGLKANTFKFYMRKKEAEKAYYQFISNL